MGSSGSGPLTKVGPASAGGRFSRLFFLASQNLDKLVKGQAEVASLISDRAFYLKTQGDKKVLAIVREDIPQHEMIDIDAGDHIQFQAWSRSSKDQVAGELEEDAKKAIEDEPAFLTMYWRNVSFVQQPNKGT